MFKALLSTALVFGAVCAVALPARASNQTLDCRAGDFEYFTATLDDSQIAAPFFNVTNASIVDGYASAQLTCVGMQLEQLACVGFWFGSPGDIVKITLVKDAHGQFTINATPLEGHLVGSSSGWACSVK